MIRAALGVVVGGLTLVGPVVLAFLALVLVGAVRREGGGVIDLTPALLTELCVGGALSVVAGAVARRVGGSATSPLVLGVTALAMGAVEAIVLLVARDLETSAPVLAPPVLVVAAPLVAGGGILLGGRVLGTPGGTPPTQPKCPPRLL